MKKRILFILPTLHAGGAENYALRFINHYKDKYDFHVLSLNLNKGDLHQAFINAKVSINYLSIGYFNFIKVFSFYKLLKKNKFNVICTFNGNFGGLPLFVAKIAKVENRIAFYRRSTNAFGKNKFKLGYNKLANFLVRKNATSILSNSTFAFKNFHEKYYNSDPRYFVISNGVNVTDFDVLITKESARKQLNLPQTAFIVGHIGRFDPAKNHKTIFSVIQKITKIDSNIKFVFCGKNTDSEAFKIQLRKFEIENAVTVLGLQEVPLVLKSFDLFYFPSVTEGQPNALIEAMISGLPILASNIFPIIEALPESAHSLMFNPLNVDDVTATILHLSKKSDDLKKYIFKDWARLKFDHIKNFALFENQINNEK